VNTTETFTDIGGLITRSSDVKGGSPRVKGTGVTVHRIAGWYNLGLSPEEIARKISHLTLRDVYASLAYYHANAEEIEGLLTQEAEDYDRLEMELSPERNG
jgi:uncharacterized protein (DUF433 family)